MRVRYGPNGILFPEVLHSKPKQDQRGMKLPDRKIVSVSIERRHPGNHLPRRRRCILPSYGKPRRVLRAMPNSHSLLYALVELVISHDGDFARARNRLQRKWMGVRE